MLVLKDIKKDYETAGAKVHALKGVSLNFRKNEFVSVLGASGCGKTTLLNIIGGLDHYTSGDLVICGKSTKDYKDHDWDVYRNHRIGFVFQSYNLIPHQTVLGNVELALTIAGISKTERKRRAQEALEKVGLGAELHKRPNQLSGGQMQRVAIARALVNNPEILLADEPTGALDTQTSIQIMELIREIAGERLVIMVTHNPELAEQYSSRIVRLSDGLVIADTNPYEETEYIAEEEPVQEIVKTDKKSKKERSSMSFGTSLGLSARNLLTKKGRTAVTSIAGSIGIISVCLVLALSNGFNNYILKTQEDMLSSNPLTIDETTFDMDAIMSGLNSASDMPDLSQIGDKVYVNSFLTNIAGGMQVTNNLSSDYLAYIEEARDYATAITYNTGLDLSPNLFTKVKMGETADTETVISLSTLKAYYTDKLSQQDEKYASLAPLVDYLGSIYGKMPGTDNVESESFGDYVLTQYDVIYGDFPTAKDEAVLVIGGNNDMTDLTLAQLGMLSEKQFLSLFPSEDGETQEIDPIQIPFDEIVGSQFMLNYNDAVYAESTSPTASYLFNYEGRRAVDKFDLGTEKGVALTITGVLRLKDGMNYGCLGDGLYMTEQVVNEYLAVNKNSQISKKIIEQQQTQSVKMAEVQVIVNKLMSLDKTAPDYETQKQTVQFELLQYLKENQSYFKRVAEPVGKYYTSSDQLMQTLGSNVNPTQYGIPELFFLYGDSAVRAVGADDSVNQILFYTDTFENKNAILAHLDAWNDSHDTADEVKYTDTVGMIMGMVEMMLNAVTYVLVAFTAISLVVSSVMIGIITYVSVVERTKEIGVLRSLGARKRDIKNLFNAETFIIGLTSGVFGVGVTYLLSIAINAILGVLTGIATLAALPITSAIIMVCVSVGLTLISGLIPAQAAAKKDPVIALRTE